MEDQLLIERTVRKYIRKSIKEFNIDIPFPAIRFSNRMTSTAAYAEKRGDSYSIVFSTAIINLNGLDLFIKDIIPHEVAHIVQWLLYDKSDHGKTFYHVMKRLGIKTAARCYHYKTAPIP